MSDDFTQVTKYLDITPSECSDDSSLKQNQGIQKSRAIKKIPTVFTIPLIAKTANDYPLSSVIWQWNFTATKQFIIANYKTLWNNSGQYVLVCWLCVRWRVDDTVYRYSLTPPQGNSFARTWQGIEVAFPRYQGQLIPENFVIEVWSMNAYQPFIKPQTRIPVVFYTSLYRNPTTPDELEDTLDYVEFVDTSTLLVALPEDLPTTYDEAGPWLTN